MNGFKFYFIIVKKSGTRWCIEVDKDGNGKLYDTNDKQYDINKFEELTGVSINFYL